MPPLTPDELLFFSDHAPALSLYEPLREALLSLSPDVAFRVQKTQITFTCPRVFACVSFARVCPKAALPPVWLVLTLGLPGPLDSPRVAVRTEPHPGRWTHHLLLTAAPDAELLSWLRAAHDFARRK